MDIHTDVLRAYKADVEATYEEVKQRLKRIGACPIDRQKTFRRQAALISAATKRAKRELVFLYLLQAKEAGLDITPTVAKHAVGRILQRSVSSAELIQRFGTPERTASEKSTISAKDLVDVEHLSVKGLNRLESGMRMIRAELKHKYWRKW